VADHPRWQTPLLATRRVVGLVLLLMAMALFVPVPLSNVVPGIMTMFIALAYLEEDGLLLTFTLTTSLVSFGVMLGAAWGATRGVIFCRTSEPCQDRDAELPRPKALAVPPTPSRASW